MTMTCAENDSNMNPINLCFLSPKWVIIYSLCIKNKKQQCDIGFLFFDFSYYNKNLLILLIMH